MNWTNGIKAKVVEKGLNYDDICSALGISKTSLSDKINNKAVFRATEIMKLADILGLHGAIEQYFFTCQKE